MTHEAFGLFEVDGYTAAMAALDAAAKSADIEVLQAEWNDRNGLLIKVSGYVGAVQAVVERVGKVAGGLNATCVARMISRPADGTVAAVIVAAEISPLLEQAVVRPTAGRAREDFLASETNQAIGFIETQGFTAVAVAVDVACKAANVDVVGREKLGGGYVAVILRGDVAAVTAAVEAGRAAVGGLGQLVATYVIARPSAAMLKLLPASL